MLRLLGIFLTAIWAAGAAAAYPERVITLLVAYPPGGGTDLIARALAPYIEKNLGGGARIVVVNRSGAGGRSASRRSPRRAPTATPSASSTRLLC